MCKTSCDRLRDQLAASTQALAAKPNNRHAREDVKKDQKALQQLCAGCDNKSCPLIARAK
jgi:hypothetical protein